MDIEKYQIKIINISPNTYFLFQNFLKKISIMMENKGNHKIEMM